MYDIRIPDHVYEQAARAAEANHVSLEQFVTEALQLHARADEPENLDHLFTPEMLAAIDESAKQAKDGKSFPIEQVRVQRTAKRKAWQENRPH